MMPTPVERLANPSVHSQTEKWSPIEVAVFEASMTLYGKNFHMVQKYVSSSYMLMFLVPSCRAAVLFTRSHNASFAPSHAGEDKVDSGGDRVLLRLEEDQPL